MKKIITLIIVSLFPFAATAKCNKNSLSGNMTVIMTLYSQSGTPANPALFNCSFSNSNSQCVNVADNTVNVQSDGPAPVINADCTFDAVANYGGPGKGFNQVDYKGTIGANGKALVGTFTTDNGDYGSFNGVKQ
jgi:hypothetical protein